MLVRLMPRDVPTVAAMLSDLGDPSAADIALALGVSRRTVHRWIAADSAPRSVMLSLFWLTRWGRSAVDCAAVNDAAHSASMAALYRRLADQRLIEIERLLSVGHFGAANSPLIAYDMGQRKSAGL